MSTPTDIGRNVSTIENCAAGTPVLCRTSSGSLHGYFHSRDTKNHKVTVEIAGRGLHFLPMGNVQVRNPASTSARTSN